LKFLRKVSKLLNKGACCFNKSANQTKAMFDNKVPMMLTWAKQVRYPWGWNRMTKHTWLTKPQNFECVPSNLIRKLIYDSFGWDCVVKHILKKWKLD
jgi:hypothetical protein